MHIIFLNPQGNFDQNDSFWTEHPDFGGQLVYVKEICIALAKLGVKVDIVTRRIDDSDWPQFSKVFDTYTGHEENLRIVRIDCGGPKFLNKEQLWEHLDAFTDNIISFYGDAFPDFATAHYGDGGYCGVLLKKKAGLDFSFTGHSLGAQKLGKLGMTLENFDRMNQRYHFSKRIVAENLSMRHASQIITSTSQERFEQYAHPLYQNAVDVDNPSKFSVIPPGVNTRVFNCDKSKADTPIFQAIEDKLKERKKPSIILSSRLDVKKNMIGVVKAYALSKQLQTKANLCIFIRGVDDPYSDISGLKSSEQQILQPILDIIIQNKLRDKVFFLDIRSQKELAATYRYFAALGSLFALTAFYEPFGLAPIEAAACGLAVVATKNGGPSEVFEDGSGILVDPFDEKEIAEGLLKGIERYHHYSELGVERVKTKYTWEKTAEAYLEVIQECTQSPQDNRFFVSELNGTEQIRRYLSEKLRGIHDK
ncbi:MAG: glycosyltransferase [Nitrospiria bacterium]